VQTFANVTLSSLKEEVLVCGGKDVGENDFWVLVLDKFLCDLVISVAKRTLLSWNRWQYLGHQLFFELSALVETNYLSWHAFLPFSVFYELLELLFHFCFD